MVKIFIIGYYGLGNVGDEAILSGIISGIRQYISNPEITVISNNPKETTRLHEVNAIKQSFKDNISIILKNVLFMRELQIVRETILQSDIVILGGGSLLQDLRIYYLPILYSLLAYAHHHSKITMIYGIGAGTIDTWFGKWLSAKVLNKVDIITVRDKMSYDVLNTARVKNVIQTADPAFSISSPSTEEVLNLQKKYNLDVPHRLIAVTAYTWLQDSDLHKNQKSDIELLNIKRKQFAEICDSIATKYNGELIFIPTVINDINGYKIISQEMKQPNRVLPYSDDYRDIYAMISSTDFIVGMRLHSQILATMAAVPIVPISYCGKVKSYLSQIDLDKYYLDVEMLQEPQFRQDLFNNIDEITKNANRQITQLDEARVRLHIKSLSSARLLSEHIGEIS